MPVKGDFKKLKRSITIKRAIGGGGGNFKITGNFKILKLTLDVLELKTKSKNKLCVLNGSFLNSFVWGGNSLFNFFKGVILKKKLEKPWSRSCYVVSKLKYYLDVNKLKMGHIVCFNHIINTVYLLGVVLLNVILNKLLVCEKE